jgi:hypothetical protein
MIGSRGAFMHLRTILKTIGLTVGVALIVVLMVLVCIPGYFIDRANIRIRPIKR